MTPRRSESRVTAEVLRAIGRLPWLKLFRNNIGIAKHANGSVVRYGVGPNGAGDFLGWETVTITPEMVGQKFARFVSLELKSSHGGRVSTQQAHWQKCVNEAGGKAVVVSDEAQARKIFGASHE